jgi:hypothetical protein
MLCLMHAQGAPASNEHASCRCKGLGGRLSGEIWDQGDAVGAWLGSAMNVIVFPTAETVKRVSHACAMHQPASRVIMDLQHHINYRFSNMLACVADRRSSWQNRSQTASSFS